MKQRGKRGKRLRSIPARYILPEVVGGHLKPYWNRRLFTTFVVCCATLQPAFPQAVQWTPFSSKEAQFSVSFCGTPTADPPTVEKKGNITGTVRLFRAGGETYFCMVGYSEYNIVPAVEQELLLNQTNFIKAVNGTVGTSRRTEFVNGSYRLPALTFTFEMPPNHTGKSIVILKGSRVYQLIFTHLKTMDYAAVQQKFLSSFEITK
jgi:hypothetical protein